MGTLELGSTQQTINNTYNIGSSGGNNTQQQLLEKFSF